MSEPARAPLWVVGLNGRERLEQAEARDVAEAYVQRLRDGDLKHRKILHPNRIAQESGVTVEVARKALCLLCARGVLRRRRRSFKVL
ncbi:GntR family transcriptional regulator [Streptomyces sp. NA02950]|nr:GntR family transcriptional regulator [Streptomyces sp. NA02950]